MRNYYPYARVIGFFTLSPLFSGFVYGLFGFVSGILYGDSYSEISFVSFIGIFFALSVGGAFVGLVYFGFPAFVVSIVYALLRLHKSWCSYLLVMVSSGMGVHLWIPVIIGGEEAQWEITDFFHSFFALGALTALVVAYFVLPKKQTKLTEG